MPEVVAGGLLPLLMAAVAAAGLGLPVLATVLVLAGLWYGMEMLLASAAGWHLSWRSPLAALVRDLLLPVVWIEGWRNGFVWRGTPMRASVDDEMPDEVSHEAAPR
jgi:ceramide glucosyltransferase